MRTDAHSILITPWKIKPPPLEFQRLVNEALNVANAGAYLDAPYNGPSRLRKPHPPMRKERTHGGQNKLPTVGAVKKVAGTCKGCQGDLDDYTKGCLTRSGRHAMRRSNARKRGESVEKGQQHTPPRTRKELSRAA